MYAFCAWQYFYALVAVEELTGTGLIEMLID
jgi:hypothetical protein